MATPIIVTAQYFDLDGNPAQEGSVTFQMNQTLRDATGNIIVSRVKKVFYLNEDGRLIDALDAIGVPVHPTNHPSLLPIDGSVKIQERIGRERLGRTFDTFIPYNAAGGTVDISELPSVRTTPYYEYVLKSVYDAHVATKASTSALGHVKVDGLTIVIDSGGVIRSVSGSGGLPAEDGVRPFPSNNIFYQTTDTLPVHASNTSWIAAIPALATASPGFLPGLYLGAHVGFHPTEVPTNQALVNVVIANPDWLPDNVDYPIPASVLIQGYPLNSGDRHVLLWQPEVSLLWELWHAVKIDASNWTADFACVWTTSSNALRGADRTSAAAYGGPMWPLITTYAEVLAGSVLHAVGITMADIAPTYVWPATHTDGEDVGSAPMGAYMRLKSTADVSGVDAFMLPLVVAMQTYGCVIVDTGDDLAVWGEQSDLWDMDNVQSLRTLLRDDFEFIDVSGLMVSDLDMGVAVSGGSGGASEHSDLTGLLDDDHSQYHNNARGDARYPLIAALTAETTNRTNADTTLTNNLASHTANVSNPHGVTSAQVGALSIANNLSDGTPATMRTNLALDNVATLLGSIARSVILKAGTLIGIRRGINFIEGSNVTLTLTDNPSSESVDVTINASNSGGTVTSVAGSLPIVSSGGNTPTISINAATTIAAGSFSASDKAKLDGVASGATANSSDGTLLARANHTGTQLAATISNFTAAVQALLPGLHASTHFTGGTDALTPGNIGAFATANNLSEGTAATMRTSLGLGLVATLLDAVARTIVSKTGSVIGTRRGINFIDGANVVATVADNAGSERIDVTLAAFTDVQVRNRIFAGPTAGADAAPTFRLMVAGDIPGGILPTVKYMLAMHNYLGAAPYAGDVEAIAGRPTENMSCSQWNIGFYVAGTNDGANYWTFQLRQLTSTISVVTQASLNTSALSGTTWSAVGTNSFFSNLQASDIWLQVNLVKTGSPGPIQFQNGLLVIPT